MMKHRVAVPSLLEQQEEGEAAVAHFAPELQVSVYGTKALFIAPSLFLIRNIYTCVIILVVKIIFPNYSGKLIFFPRYIHLLNDDVGQFSYFVS